MAKDKGKPIFGLNKLSTEELLKASRIEVGKLKSYIDELEYNNKKLRRQIIDIENTKGGKQYKLTVEEQREVSKSVVKDNMWKDIKKRNNTLLHKNRELMKDNKNLIEQIVKLKSKLEEH